MNTTDPILSVDDKRADGCYVLRNSVGFSVAHVYPSIGAEEEGFVAVLAAAPDMLRVLQGLLADPYLSDPINADRMAAARTVLARIASVAAGGDGGFTPGEEDGEFSDRCEEDTFRS